MKPDVRVFSRESPCTKKDIWLCFRRRTGFAAVQVAQAQSFIGINVPRVLEREGRMVKVVKNGVECYALTEAGAQWLLKGMRAYLRNHPSERDTMPFINSLERKDS